MTAIQKPKVLVLGVSGQIGRFVLAHLDKYPETLSVRITARRPEQVQPYSNKVVMQSFLIWIIPLRSPQLFTAWIECFCSPDTQSRCWRKARHSLTQQEKHAFNTWFTWASLDDGIAQIHTSPGTNS